MESPSRKPPGTVRSISGSYQPDVVTRAEFVEGAELQATAWLAEKNAREHVQRIEQRIENGARIEDCEYVFDRELQMIRTKKEKAG